MNIASIAARLKGAFGFVTAEQSVTGGITKIWSGSQAEYDAIATKADDTLYVVV